MSQQLMPLVATDDDRPIAAELVGGRKRLLIGDAWVDALSGETFETIDPTTEQVLTVVAAADTADVDRAVAAARRALESALWSDMNPHDRTRVLLAIADQVEAHADELAALESFDMGAPLSLTRHMVRATAQVFRYYAGWPTKICGQTNPTDKSQFSYTVREPIGVCAGILPWNAPVLTAAWKIAPALACANTIIIKPAEQTPLSALRLGQLILDAGVPAGVVNVLTGFGETAGAALVAHRGVDKVAFTGSGAVGKEILRSSAGNLKRVTLELGGKSPNVILADADLVAAAAGTAGGFLNNSGQVCAAGTRIFVQERVSDEFAELLSEQVSGYQLGDPFHPETRLGPLASREQLDRVSSYLDVGRDEGAIARTGGAPLEGTGYFVPPTVFDGVHNSMRVAQEEIFGPVAAVIPFRDVDDALLQGNDTVFGLAAGVWTRDISKAHQVARSLRAGTVYVNRWGGTDCTMPFGGYKESGLGRELGAAALESYTETKTVLIQL